MAVIDNEISTDDHPSVEPEDGSTENLQVPKQKKRRTKSPTPGRAGSRAASMTPGPRSSRSQTPFSLYLQRHSEDPALPVKWRSITPFINRQSKEKTPFELGTDIKSQLIAHKMVFDKASCMDITDEANYQPVRYITSDMSVVDRASVMDVSNVEVIYLVEEYDDTEYEEYEEIEEVEETKKKKGKKGGRKSKSVDKEDSPGGSVEREKKTKTVKKKVIKKREEEERSPSPPPLPKLKLDLGGGPKMNKKLFEQKPASGPDAKPPPKRMKVPIIQMEEQTKEQSEERQDSEVREDSEFRSDLELSENPDEDAEDELIEEEPEPEPEPTPEEIAQMEAEKREAEEREKERLEKERIENERLEQLRIEQAHVERWNRIREEEGEGFLGKIKRFILQKRDDPSNPCFVNHLPNGTQLEGKNLRITCSVNGANLSIRWYKFNKEIKSDDKFKIKTDADVLSLEILNCTKGDSGEYSCTISNKKKKVTSTCFVSIYDLSKFIDEPCPPAINNIQDNYHYINDELIIECRVLGTPRPLVTWHRENYEIKTDKVRTIVEKSHGVHALIIKRPTTHDTGVYVIKASNTRGEYERKHVVEFFVTTEKVVNMSIF